MSMVRKQIFLTQELDEKVKSLARERGVAEAEVVRDALDAFDDRTAFAEASDHAPAQSQAGENSRERVSRQLRAGTGRKILELARKHALENAGVEQRKRTWTRDDLYDE